MVAYLIADGIILQIAAVSDITKTFGRKIIKDLLSAKTEEGTDDVRGLVARDDTCEAVEAGAAHEVHEEGLDAVVLVVS